MEINYAEQNGSKFSLDVLEGMMGVGGGGLFVTLGHFRLLKRALPTLISNRMSPFRSFYDNSFNTKCPGMKKKLIHCANIVLYLGSVIALPMM
jgi:hypothetical protein